LNVVITGGYWLLLTVMLFIIETKKIVFWLLVAAKHFNEAAW